MIFARRDVPLQKDASARYLPWLIGFMVYLATLALAAALAVSNLAERWDTGLAGRLTVQIPPPGPDSQVSRAAQVNNVVDTLKRRPGIASARPIPDERVREMLAPWLGERRSLGELPLPALVAARVNRANPPDMANLQAAVQTAAPRATIDDHQRTLGRLLEVVRSFQGVAVLVMGLVTAAAVVTVIFATRTGLAVHRNVIEILHLIGAQDGYIARQFQHHALRLGLLGGVIGVVLAAATLLILREAISVGGGALIPDLALAGWQWASLGLIPVATAAVATATARLTVLRTLARLA
ncbi:cell division transport system permease protein [Limimonas halophila]|uniref:Cell division transport system permease protein n=1 Tax=Limimonas halophila TaxID=1082479 RepID=A0A1G7TSJ3_9PROT|nr:hypothetical protein [Limimonas halophila]SDG38316.1 cell division transport system permease protein [Limimonas halophila]